MPSEAHLLQIITPREALRHEFLMDGILSYAAFDLPIASAPAPESAEYARAALEYYDHGLAAFTRARTGSISEDNALALFVFGTMKLILDFLVPQFRDDGDGRAYGPARRAAMMIFDSLPALSVLTQACWQWLEQSPVQLYAFLEQNVPYELLNENVKQAIRRLLSVNERYHTRSRPTGGIESPDDSSGPDPDHDSYQSAILHLEGIFARELDATLRATLISWMALVDERFVGNFKQSKPVALLIMMHWAVLVNNLGKEAWWAGQAGRNLVAELSVELQRSQLARMPEWQESIAWTRRQVSLPDLLF